MWLAQQKHSAGATAPLALGGGVGAIPVDCALCALVRPATPQLASVQADGQRGNGSQTDTRCARPLSAYRTPHSLHATHQAPPGYKYDYLHGPHMYDLSQMSNRKLKWGLASAGILVAGFGIPIYAVRFSNQKAGVW